MSKRRRTPCACKPVWHDNLYGRDQATGNSSWRRQEIAAELLGSYSLQTRLLQDNKTWRLMVHGPRTPSLNGCTDAFYGRVQGTVIEALRFRVVAATGSPCTYEATWWPRYAGQYSVNVWLTYANNSAMLSPEEFAPVLSHLRDRLKPALGKLKAIDRSLKDNPARLLNDRDRAYGAVLQQVPGSPWSVQASAKARLERGRQILEPWCAPGQFDGSGAWVSVRACESDDSCAAQGHPYKAVAANHSLHMQYLHVWKPHGCRLRQFVDAPAFEAALQERAAAHGPKDATRTAKCNQSTDSTRWRVLLAGDSLMREEYCALRQFLLDGRRFGELLHAADCFHGDNATVRTAHLIVSFVGINGFYDSFFGWRDLPGRTEQQINVVLQAADRLRPHVLIWLDGAHSMELNSITDFLATLNTTARLFAHALRYSPALRSVAGTLVQLQVPYVHTLGPQLNRSQPGFYPTTWGGLQAPRVLRVNELSAKLLRQLGIDSYDTSVVHEPRPESSRDKMHWGFYQWPDRARAAEADCDSYCHGTWAQMKGFTTMERNGYPELPYAQTQILLNLLLSKLGKYAYPCSSS